MKRNLSLAVIALTWLVLTGFKDASVEEIKTLTETFAASYIKDFLKIAYVDLEDAVLTVPEMKEMMDNMERWLKEKQAIIDAKESKLKDMDDMYKKQEMILSDSAKEKKRKEFQEEFQDYQQVSAGFQEDLARKRKEVRDLQLKVVENMKDIVKEIGTQGKYILVLQLPKNGILHSTDNVVDITSLAVEKYNKLFPRGRGSKR